MRFSSEKFSVHSRTFSKLAGEIWSKISFENPSYYREKWIKLASLLPLSSHLEFPTSTFYFDPTTKRLCGNTLALLLSCGECRAIYNIITQYRNITNHHLRLAFGDSCLAFCRESKLRWLRASVVDLVYTTRHMGRLLRSARHKQKTESINSRINYREMCPRAPLSSGVVFAF